jgi:dihydroxy-acid dehydratase
VLHLLAIAGRVGIELALDDFDRLGSHMPLLVNLMPSGEFLMEDFFYAGGLPAVIEELKAHLDLSAITVNGQTLGQNTAAAPNYNRKVIAAIDDPVQAEAGLTVLRGNLCESGAIIKPSAATPSLLRHRGRAVVFEDYEDFEARVDSPDLDVDKDCILVLQNAGPKGFPGMPEVGNFHLPKKILAQGVNDMIRISDARMSGTAFGTVVLHIAPESAIGGTLGLVRNGDMIELDVPGRRLHLEVSPEELAQRRAAWRPRPAHSQRGYVQLYVAHVQQADTGADFDFLVGKSGAGVAHGNH